MKSAFVLLLAGLPFVASAQTTTQAELLRRGGLTGSRPSTTARSQVRQTVPRATATAAAAADPVQQHLLQTDVNLAQAPADQLPNLYERFMATTRDERRQWSYAQ